MLSGEGGSTGSGEEPYPIGMHKYVSGGGREERAGTYLVRSVAHKLGVGVGEWSRWVRKGGLSPCRSASRLHGGV